MKTSIRISHATGVVEDIGGYSLGIPRAPMAPLGGGAGMPPTPCPASTRKIKRGNRSSLQELSINSNSSVASRVLSQEVAGAILGAGLAHPLHHPATLFNRGRSNSMMYPGDIQRLEAILSQSSQADDGMGGEYCTPSDHVIEPWASQEHAMPPTPDHQRKKARHGPLDTWHKGVSDSLSDNPNRSTVVGADESFQPANLNIFRQDIQAFLRQKGKDTTPAPRLVFTSGCSMDDSSVSIGMSVGRYKEEFEQKRRIGTGNGGNVYHCQHRLDGWDYAVKVLRKEIDHRSNSVLLRETVKEVFAQAAVSSCPYIVSFYSAWYEDEQLYIQMEHCQHGNLTKRMAHEVNQGTEPREAEMKMLEILMQVARGLQHMHSRNMAHLDIKPDNILLADIPAGDRRQEDKLAFRCKIGDFGLVASTVTISTDPKQGDNRYVCDELMQRPDEVQLDALKACDIFSLGATVYEMAIMHELPSQGPAYRALREIQDTTGSRLPGLERYSPEFCSLISQMMHVDGRERPTVEDILNHEVFECLHPEHRELQSYRNYYMRLSRRLERERELNNKVESEVEILRSRLNERSVGPQVTPGRNLFDDDDDDDDGVLKAPAKLSLYNDDPFYEEIEESPLEQAIERQEE